MTALPQLQQEGYYAERDALAEPASSHEDSIFLLDRRNARGGRKNAALGKPGSAASKVGGTNTGVPKKVDSAAPKPEIQNTGIPEKANSAAPKPESQNTGMPEKADFAAPKPESQNTGVPKKADSAPPKAEDQTTDAPKKEGSRVLETGGRFVKEFGPDLVRTVFDDANEIAMHKLLGVLDPPAQTPQLQAPPPQPQAPAPPPQDQPPQPQNQTLPPQDQPPQPQRRAPSWESAVAKEAARLFKEYAPEIGKSIVKTTANNINQNQQQPTRRDPNFFQSLGADFKKAAHGAENVVKTVAPIALQYAPEIAGVLMARDLQAVARDLMVLEARDPKFFQTLEKDIKKGAKSAENLAMTYGPDIAMALMDHQPSEKKARALDWEGALVRRGAEIEGFFEGVYERDAEPDVDFDGLYGRDAKAELYFDGLYERDAEAESYFDGLYERDAEAEPYFDGVVERDMGYFGEHDY